MINIISITLCALICGCDTWKAIELFGRAEEYGHEGMVYRRDESKDYGHGRIEEREYRSLPMMYLDKFKREWKDLKTFIKASTRRHLATGVVEMASRYYISSLH